MIDEKVWGPIVRRIFRDIGQGRTMKQVASGLNCDGIRSPDGKDWRASRVGQLLRDRHVLGFYTPTKWVDVVEEGKTVRRRVPATRRVGDVDITMGEVKIAPAVVTLEEWYKARDVLEGRERRLRGRRGKNIPNLFTGRTACATCGGRLRADTGGASAGAVAAATLSAPATSRATPARTGSGMISTTSRPSC
ncbi:recombinase family protein [Siccirubricoccus deserti]